MSFRVSVSNNVVQQLLGEITRSPHRLAHAPGAALGLVRQVGCTPPLTPTIPLSR